MTDEQLAAIEARAQAAAPGPWRKAEFYHRLYVEGPNASDVVFGSVNEADEAFIAHAREDVPALVAEVKRLRARLDMARGALADIASLKKPEISAGVAQRKAQRIYDETKDE